MERPLTEVLSSIGVAAKVRRLLPHLAIAAAIADPAIGAVPKSYECHRNFYVNGTTGTDKITSGNQLSPWKTIQFANDSGVLSAGDCVNVAAGRYLHPNGLRLTRGGDANTNSGYVVYKGAPNRGSHITGGPSALFLINILASYIIVDGFDVDGAGIKDAAIADNNAPGGVGHHIGILNNAVHDSPGGGINLNHTDYFTVFGNVVYNTSGGSLWQESGISIYEPQPITNFNSTLPFDNELFHIEIANNIVYNNMEKPVITVDHTDGNGIILDDWLDTQNAPHKPYPYKGLVQSNLVYGNGGRGIHVYLSANIVVANNTVFNNNLDPLIKGTWRGELSNVASYNVTWINNVAWASPAQSDPYLRYNTAILEGTYGKYSNANVVWQNNITFNGVAGQASVRFDAPDGPTKTSAFPASNRAGVDPVIKSGQPRSGSPAIGTGVATPDYPPLSLRGSPMPSPPNIGAY